MPCDLVRPHPELARSRGVTLTEIAVTIVVGTILILVIFNFMAWIGAFAETNARGAEAVRIADGELARVLSRSFDSLVDPDEQYHRFVTVTLQDGSGSRDITYLVERQVYRVRRLPNGTLHDIQPNAALMHDEYAEVTVRVSWPAPPSYPPPAGWEPDDAIYKATVRSRD